MTFITPTCTFALRRIASIRILSLLASALLATTIAGSAFAQSIDIPAALNPDLKAPPTIVTVQGGHQFNVDVNGSTADMSRSNYYFGVNHRVKIDDKSSLFLMGTYTLHQYDFDNKGVYQWDDVHRLVLAGLFGYDLNEHWRLMGGGMYRSWGQTGADYRDSITGGVLGGFDYHPNEDFSIGLLVGIISNLENPVGIIPVPTVKWKFAPDWRLNVGMVSVLDPGLGAEVTWQISDTFALGTGLTYQTRRYRLNDHNEVFSPSTGRSTKDGIGQEQEVPLFAMLQWRPTPKTAIDLMGGVAVAGKLKVESESGGKIENDTYSAAPFLGLKGQIAF